MAPGKSGPHEMARGSSGILQARTLEWVAISFSNFMGIGSSQSQRRDPNPSRHSFQPRFPLLVAGLELGVDSNCGVRGEFFLGSLKVH